METNSTQQEILLITGTTFSSRQLAGNDDPDNNKQLTEKELLEQACWNGFLQEMLPEIFKTPVNTEKLWLWQIKEAESFLELELGEFPEAKDKHFSIDPHSFLSTQSYN